MKGRRGAEVEGEERGTNSSLLLLIFFSLSWLLNSKREGEMLSIFKRCL